MNQKFFLFTIIITISVLSYAQPKLQIVPDKIEFNSNFDRLKNVLFINSGTDTVSIDSIYYKNYNYYFLRFNVNSQYPVMIPPGDTIIMDCIITNYYYISPYDTSDNMLVYSNGSNQATDIKININYNQNYGGSAKISGYITGNNTPQQDAKVYIIHDGSSIARTVSTNSSGFFSAIVPAGLYTVAAKKDSFYTTFYGQTYSPYESKIINLQNDDSANISIDLTKLTQSSFSICGKVEDSLSLSPLGKAIIIARKGGHTPSKLNGLQNDLSPANILSAIINPDGTYEIDNITEPGYYKIQSFSEYYVPSYLKSNDISTPFWQDADSIYVNSDICDLNILMPRDSAVGNGVISGNVLINQGTGSNFSDVLVFAQSIETYSIFNHTIVADDGNFAIKDLPYGHYRLVAEKTGYETFYSYTVTIDSLQPAISNIEISFDISGVQQNDNIPDKPFLYQNFPNPFNPTTTIKYSIPVQSFVTLKVYDILGREVTTLVDEEKQPGTFNVAFNASSLASGVYFLRIKAGDFVQTRKMILLQ